MLRNSTPTLSIPFKAGEKLEISYKGRGRGEDRAKVEADLSKGGVMGAVCPSSTAKILALCAPMPSRNRETELWRRKKEWLYFFARKEEAQ